MDLAWEEWEARVRAGRIPEDALVSFEPVTGDEAVPAGELDIYRSLRDEAVERFRGQFRIGPPPIVTALLVGVQIRLWWVEWIPGVQPVLDGLFAVNAPWILEDGEVWRLLTGGFLHSGFEHISINMLMLAYTGWNLERAYGRANLLLLFLASVFGGYLLSMTFTPETWAVGASGGVFGLVGASVVFGLTRPELLPPRARSLFGLAMLPYLVVFFMMGLWNPRVDNWAHFGGMITGIGLAFLLEPEAVQRRLGWNRRVAGGVVAVCVAIMAGMGLAGPRIEGLRDVEEARRIYAQRRSGRAAPEADDEDYRALFWSVPDGWSPGVDAEGSSAFVSPTWRGEARAWGVSAGDRERIVSTSELAEAWTEDLRKRHPEASFGPAESAILGGQYAGLAVRAELPPTDRLDRARVLEWRGVARGVWALQEVWQVDLAQEARLAPLRDRLRRSVVWKDPEELYEARLDYEHAPQSARARAGLALALTRAGELERALALHGELLAEAPADRDRWVDALRTVEIGAARLDDAEQWWDRALAEAPEPAVLDHVARGLVAAGREAVAEGLLDEAWRRFPGDRRLARARRRQGLSRELDPVTGQPWTDVHDPISGERRLEPRQPSEEDLTVELAAALGQARRAEQRDIVRATREAFVAGSSGAWLPLLYLREGHHPPLDEDLRATLLAEVQRAREERPPRWLPDELYEALAAHPAPPFPAGPPP